MTGPRKTGKTVCLKQLEDIYETEPYIDFKVGDDLYKQEIIDKVCNSIRNKEYKVFLLDEFTHLFQPDSVLERIANTFHDTPDTKTKVVISGSQSYALRHWANSVFAGNMEFVNIDFLGYDEWLRFAKQENSPESYQSFVQNTRLFYKDYKNILDYIEGCLHETAISNFNSANIVLNNDVQNLTVDKILDILYASLFSGHNCPNYEAFFNKDLFSKLVVRYFKEDFKINKDLSLKKIEWFLKERYQNYTDMNFHEYAQGLLFLQHSGLVTLTYEGSKKINRDIVSDLENGKFREVLQNIANGEDNGDFGKKTINSHVNITVNYPMFYFDLVKYILDKDEQLEINQELLGSIYESQLRGLLPNRSCFVYRTTDSKEIDYVNCSRFIAIEASVRTKERKEVHFEILDRIGNADDYIKILTTKEKKSFNEKEKIVSIPYYEFLFELSSGKCLEEIYEEIVQHSKKKGNQGGDDGDADGTESFGSSSEKKTDSEKNENENDSIPDVSIPASNDSGKGTGESNKIDSDIKNCSDIKNLTEENEEPVQDEEMDEIEGRE